MPPIQQPNINEYYKSIGFDNQESYFEKIDDPTDIRMESFDEFQKDFNQRPPMPIREVEQEIQFEQPMPINAKKSDLDFAVFAKDSYRDVDKRNDIGNHKYIEEDSNNLLSTYYDDKNENLIMAIKGTSKFSDLRKDVGIALGSFGGAAGIEPEYFGLTQKIKENEKKYKRAKKITVTGHSAGGSFANYVGVDNPNYDVVTYNMGQGLPFISDYVKCKMGGCQNIKNYRVAGDFASSLSDWFSSGNVHTIRPRKPTEEMRLEAESKESIFIPADLHIPHSIDQFIGRTMTNMNPDPYVYGRKLASRVGGFAAGIGLPLISGIAGSKSEQLINKEYNELLTQKDSAFENEMALMEEMVSDLDDINVQTPGFLVPFFQEQMESAQGRAAETIVKNTASNLFKIKSLAGNINKVSTIAGGLVGVGLGNVAGNLIYDNILKTPENQFADI